MKKRRFYTNNKKRNQKWTEEPQGHKIDFAEKYIGDGPYSDKFDSKRPTEVNEQKKRKKARNKRRAKNALIVVCCILLVCVGYTCMDIHMTRHATPIKSINSDSQKVEGNMAEMSINISAYKVESVGFDASIMLSSIMKDIENTSFSSLVFDAKREDGTIGYSSKLAYIDTFNAISSPSSQPYASAKQLIDNDILPIARICCYKDNVVPRQDNTAGIMTENGVYTDSNGNTYLNPDSESAYSYLKDIINECYDFGITVFILNGCDLPSDISDSYNDGFDALTERLNKDLNGKVKFLEEVDEAIVGKDNETGKITEEAIQADIDKFSKINSNQIFYISTKVDNEIITDMLNKNGIFRYVIED